MYSVRASTTGDGNISAVAEHGPYGFIIMKTSSSDLQIFAAGLAVGLTAGFVGLLFRRSKMKRDALLLAVLTLYFCRQKVLNLLPYIPFTPSEVIVLLAPLLVFNGIQIVCLYKIKDTRPGPTLGIEAPSALKPFIFPASTSHTRFFPRHHSFKYSYFLVGVPVGWQGRIDNLLACDDARSASWWKDAWLSVHAEDYLFYTRPSPGSQAPSLRGKLDAYLRSEDADPALYAHAYLVTAPRVLGFNFNPVSFWYLYDAGMTLKSMILEVNNTFGERTMYLLREAVSPDGNLSTNGTYEKEISLAELHVLDERRTKKFTSKWNKDFHVSPFNDREGVYSLTAIDPFGSGVDEAVINNIINLSSAPYDTLHPEPLPTRLPDSQNDAGACTPRTKLVASIASTSTVDPTILSLKPAKQYKFLLKHIWIGFLTNPRILREAWTLWMKGLKVWYRPEVHATTVGREETQEETAIEKVFEGWLKRVVTRNSKTLRYFPAAGERRGQCVVLRGSSYEEAEDEAVSAHKSNLEQEAKIDSGVMRNDARIQAQQEALEVKILTPAFYSEVIRTSHFREAWEERCFNAKEDEAMVWTNDKKTLEGLIDSETKISSTTGDGTRKAGEQIDILRREEKWFKTTERIGSALISTFGYKRRGKGNRVKTGLLFADVVNPHAAGSTPSPATEKQFADLIRASIHIHFADKYALGSIGLLRFYGSVMHFALVWMAAKQLSIIIMDGAPFGRGMACNMVAIMEWSLLVMWLLLVGMRSFWRTTYTYS